MSFLIACISIESTGIIEGRSKMDEEWLTRYYRGLGWSEQRITDFLHKTELNEKHTALVIMIRGRMK